MILERRDEKKPEAEPEVIDVDEAENIGGTGIMQVTADFNEMIVWGHEAVADASGDPYVRSIEEWLQVADQVRRCFSKVLTNSLTRVDQLVSRTRSIRTEVGDQRVSFACFHDTRLIPNGITRGCLLV